MFCMKDKMIYLDNNATTKVDAAVLEEMLPYFTEQYGNPSSIRNAFGKAAHNAVEDSMYMIMDCFNAGSINDFVITSGATESNNLAITGVLEAYENPKKHIVVSCIEHSSIKKVCAFWEKKGIECTYLPVNAQGVISIQDLKNSIRNETCLISIMSANNEIGTIQPIEEAANLAKENGILFHTDATQYLYFDFWNVKKIPIDMISFSAHKLHGPKGIGGLYVDGRARKKIQPIILGGGQQKNLRSGTLNVPGIVGMAKAMCLLKEEQSQINIRMTRLRNLLLDKLSEKNMVCVNGSLSNRIPNNLNIYFPGISAMALIEKLPNLIFSTDSACSSQTENEKNEVLHAIGRSDQQIKESIRLGLSKFTTEEEVISAANQFKYALEMIS